MTDPVVRVIDALNTRDLDAFVACYAENATIEDGYDAVFVGGHDGLRARYREFFDTFPELRVDPLSRVDVGAFVVQEERVTGRGEPARHVAVYLVEDGMIARERLLR